MNSQSNKFANLLVVHQASHTFEFEHLARLELWFRIGPCVRPDTCGQLVYEPVTVAIHFIAWHCLRRRCFGHIAWRVADSGISEMGTHGEHLHSLNTYLRDSTTWTRMQALATQHPDQGGLGLMVDCSPAFFELFRQSPPALIDERPECVLVFLEWLLPRLPANSQGTSSLTIWISLTLLNMC
jgi:hypothetical protein